MVKCAVPLAAVDIGPDGRTLIENGRLRIVRGVAAARVLLTRRLRRMRGEWFLQQGSGLRLVEIKQQRPPNIGAFEVDIASQAMQIYGVQEARATAALQADRALQVTLNARWVDPADPREAQTIEIVEVL